VTRCPRCQRRFPPSGECPAHGRPTSVGEISAADKLPAVSPPAGWEVGRLLAIGGTAVVYELAGKTPAVLKWARFRARDIRARFAIEADVLRGVGPPATPALIDHGIVDDAPYLIMEHVTGETLAAWMARTGERGGLGEIIAILTRIAMSLGALHEAAYVHRDLKPENICIGPRGARLLDFGIAKHMGGSSELTQAGVVVGTTHYIAPEQIRMAGVVDQRADIYSFGVIAFEMLAGRPPFVGERRALEYQHQVARPPSVLETRAIPQELDDFVQRCLAKQPDARPQSAAALREELARALGSMGTLRGVGAVTPSTSQSKPIGTQSEVALAWIVGGDPVIVARAIGEMHGLVVRQKGDGILAAFTAAHHDAPLTVALGACRGLARERCRVVIHASTALVRRSAQGKPMVYGKDIENVDAWTPPRPFVGLVLSPQAAERARSSCVPAPDVPGFSREKDTTAGNTTDVEAEPTLVGRLALVDRVVAATLAKPMLVAIAGEPGAGKTRVLDAIAEKLRIAGRDVVRVRARRCFLGESADDERLRQVLADEPRTRVLIVDDADRFSTPLLHELAAKHALARIVASTHVLLEVPDGVDDRIAIELPPLTHDNAGALLREQLRPARLIPDVLIDRLALRGAGNPRLLLALARDMKRRGAVRRNAGSDDWYVAVDELDTLLAPPGPSWLAARAIDDLPPEIAPVLRMCTGLGPQFCAGEVAHVVGVSDIGDRLAYLVRIGVFIERNGWYELEDGALQDAIYDHVLDERELVHARALQYWLANRGDSLGWIARVAYHAAGSHDRGTASACWIELARAAFTRGEHDLAQRLLARASAILEVAPGVRDALE
jgi:hypothetical protein